MATKPDEVTDPNSHFPYKHDVVVAAVEANAPAGPDGPDDDRVRVEDFMSRAIADATKVYVEAQEAYLTHPGDGTRAEYEAAKADLVAARQAHRANRRGITVPASIRATRANGE